jgi:hypothetical protein
MNWIDCAVESMGRYRQAVWLAAALYALATSACGGGSSSSSCTNPPALAGDWSGTILNDTAGGGTLTISFNQTACTLGGAWSAQYADPADDGSGSVQGTADASGISFDLVNPVTSGCGYTVTASLPDPDEMTGQFSTIGLHCTASGSFDLLRRSTASPTAMPMATAMPMPTAAPTP